MSNLGEPSTAGSTSKPVRDSLSVAMDAIDDRWSLHIVRALAFGASRYTEVLRAVGAPRDVLASRLRTLSDAGIVRRRDADGERPAGYELTPKGRDLGQVILVLKAWGDTYRDPGVPVVEFVHDGCGRAFVPDLHCRSCGAPFRSGDLHVREDPALESVDPVDSDEGSASGALGVHPPTGTPPGV